MYLMTSAGTRFTNRQQGTQAAGSNSPEEVARAAVITDVEMSPESAIEPPTQLFPTKS